MKLTIEQATETVTRWINSSNTIEQVECCELFIQDTIYIRFGAADKQVKALRALAEARKQSPYIQATAESVED